MTRFGVMKHLAVLEEAGLVVTQREGRTKLPLPQPGPDPRDPRPLDQQVRHRPTAEAMTELRRRLDGPR